MTKTRFFANFARNPPFSTGNWPLFAFLAEKEKFKKIRKFDKNP